MMKKNQKTTKKLIRINQVYSIYKCTIINYKSNLNIIQYYQEVALLNQNIYFYKAFLMI